MEERLVEVLDAIDTGVSTEEALGAHPEHKDVLGRRLAMLGKMNLSGSFGYSPPRVIGRWRLRSLLGRGGMGEVWLANALDSEQDAALKFVRMNGLDQTQLKRFQREAAALRRLNHPGIVRLLDAGESAEHCFIAMERLDGQSLRAHLDEQGTPDVPLVLRWGRDIADALRVAHGEGILHRDVKPSNIQITPNGRAILMDFGLTRGVSRSSLSQTGRFVGSPHYAAPEQIHGDMEGIGPQADVYGLGATLYEALAGKTPFEGSSTEQLFHRILSHDPLPLRKHNPAFPGALELVLQKALEKRPKDRYASVSGLAADLEAVVRLQPVSARPPSFLRRLKGWQRRRPSLAAGAAVAVLALLITGASAALNQRSERSARSQQAQSLLAEAEDEFARFIQQESQLPARIASLEFLRKEVETNAFDPEKVRRFDSEQLEIEEARTLRERTFTSVMERLRLVEDLDPRLAAAAAKARARVYLERWENARLGGDSVMSNFFAERVRETDPGGQVAAQIDLVRQVQILTEPEGARVDAFRYVRYDGIHTPGEPRLVPIPMRGQIPNVDPGQVLWRMLLAPPPLASGDLVLDVEGLPLRETVLASWSDGLAYRLLSVGVQDAFGIGRAEDLLDDKAPGPVRYSVLDAGVKRTIETDEVPLLQSLLEWAQGGERKARVWRDGEILDVLLPPGATYRPTAAALLPCPSSLVGRTPLPSAALEGGELLLLIRLDGYEPLRLLLPSDKDAVHVQLTPLGTYPPPFVRVQHRGQEMIVMDREVTVGEFQSYLEADPTAQLPPGWNRNSHGHVQPPTTEKASYPVHSISHRESQAYARWRTDEARAAGHDWSFRLPASLEWIDVLQVRGYESPYPWGAHFRPHFAKGCFSRARPRIEPVLRFPIDETQLGLYDTAGGVAEFCDGWFWEERQQRPVSGASWVHAEPVRFENRYLWGTSADQRMDFVGLRLVLIDGDP